MAGNEVKEPVYAEITLTVRSVEPGLLVSLRTTGDFRSQNIDRRFYSIDQMPSGDVTPEGFWAPILWNVAQFLTGE